MSLRVGLLVASLALASCAHPPSPSVAELIAQGKDADALAALRESPKPPATDPGWSLALARAAHGGNAELVAALLDRGADPNGRSTDARVTPLHFALDRSTSRVWVDVTRVLLERGADPKLADAQGATPLHYLAARPALFSQKVKQDAVQLLLEHGASGAPAPGEPWTVLHHSAAAGDDEPILRLLIEHGADPSARGQGGLTPLDAAVAANHAGVTPFLFERGSRPQVFLTRTDWPVGDLEVHREFEISGRSHALYADWERGRGNAQAAREADRVAETQLSLAVAELQRALAATRSATTKAGHKTAAEISTLVLVSAARLPAVVVAALGGESLVDPDRRAERVLPLNERADEISRDRAATQQLLDQVRARLAAGGE